MKTACWQLTTGALLAIGLIASDPATGNASLVWNELSDSTSNLAYVGSVSSSDLVNDGSPDLVSESSAGVWNGSYPATTINDGGLVIAGGTGNSAYFNFGANGAPSNYVAPTVTYVLDTTTNPLGYDIDQIASFQGGTTSTLDYANQYYDIYYSLVGDESNFLPLTQADFQPFSVFNDTIGPGATYASLSDDTLAPLASGVAALRFDFLNNLGWDGKVIQEIDVFGAPTQAVPEPGALAIWLVGTLGLVILGRCRN